MYSGILQIILINSYAFMNEAPHFLGSYILRKTNDLTLNPKYTYLILNENNIKLQTITTTGIFGTKISRTGNIRFIKNYKTIFNPFYFITIGKKLNNMIVDNDLLIEVIFTNRNKYSYSLFGIQYPDFKYKSIAYNDRLKKLRIKQKNYTFYMYDEKNDYFYIFDLLKNFNKMPYVEAQFNTLLFTQLISFISNLILVKLLDLL